EQLPLLLAHQRDDPGTKDRTGSTVFTREQRRRKFFLRGFRRLRHILAVVATLGRCLPMMPGPERLHQLVDLDAGVVDVELAGDRMPGPFVERGDPVTKRRASAVTDMQGACGVRGHE